MKRLDAARYAASRQSQVQAGGYTFTVRRPYVAEVVGGQLAGQRPADLVARFTVGWAGVKESDLMPGGDPEDTEFSPALFAAWIQDQPALWAPLSEAIVESYTRYEQELEAQGKLLPAG